MRFLALLIFLMVRAGMVAHLPVEGKATRTKRHVAGAAAT
jgi:hypothetical protein